MTSVYQSIAGKVEKMSKSQRKIAQYMLEHLSQVPFLTVSKLAKIVGVSEATVVRFAVFVGYSGYTELQEQLQQSLQQQLTTTEKLKISNQMYEEKDKGIYQLFQDDIENMNATVNMLDMEDFYQAVDDLLRARRIYIVANRSAMSLAVFLEYYLHLLLNNVKLLQSVEKDAERLYDLGEKDVVLGISFSRYTKSTVDLFSFAKEREATTIAITDHLLSPLIPYADVALRTVARMPTVLDSFVAPLSLINALVTCVSRAREGEFQARLDGLEEIWDRFNVFHKKQQDKDI